MEILLAQSARMVDSNIMWSMFDYDWWGNTGWTVEYASSTGYYIIIESVIQPYHHVCMFITNPFMVDDDSHIAPLPKWWQLSDCGVCAEF